MNCLKCKKEIPDGAIFCPWCGRKQTPEPRKPKKRGNGQGTAFRRGKTFTASWVEKYYLDEDGVKHVKRHTKGGFKTLSAALAYAANPPAPSESSAADKPPTLRDYFNTYKNGQYKKLSASKQTAYKIAWERWEDLAEYEMRNLKIATLQNQLDDKVETYYPAKDMRSVLSAIYALAIADGVVTVNLSKFLTIPPLEETEPEPFNEDEIAALWRAYESGDDFSAYILIMIYTGMMPGELMICRTEMIDYEKNEIVGSGIKTKRRKTRPMVFPDFLIPVLQDVASRSKKGKLLEMNKDNFYDKYHATTARVGIRDLKPYSCRHTTATALVLSGAALPTIKNIMRHTKITTTQRYMHPDTSESIAAVNALKNPLAEKTR